MEVHHTTQKVKIEPAVSLQNFVEQFKKEYGISKIIAFSGGADQKKQEMEHIIEEMMQKLAHFNIAILTGATKGGIPETATLLAKKYSIPIIGVLPLAGEKYALPSDFFNLHITVEPSYCKSYWGDESAIFAKLCDAMIVMGGAGGTLVEVSHAMKINESLCKENSTRLPIYVVPVLGLSGVSEVINFLPFKDKIKQAVLPTYRIFEGKQAADFIIDKLDLYSDYTIS